MTTQTMPKLAKILIVDDHPMVREGLSIHIATHGGMEVCGEAEDPQGAMTKIQTTDPDLVIVEVQGDNELAGSDRRYQNHYLMFLRFTDGLVSHWREFSNPDVFRQATS